MRCWPMATSNRESASPALGVMTTSIYLPIRFTRSRITARTLWTGAVVVAVAAAEVIELDSRLELLVDDFLIERMEGARLQLHRPIPQQVAPVHDAPRKGNISFYHTVFQDGDLYRSCYRGQHYDNANNKYSLEVGGRSNK